MSVLKLKCVDQVLTILTTPLITSGAKEVNEVSCEFDSTWNNFVKTAVFYKEESNAFHILMNSNSCKIPEEVIKTDGVLYIGIFGVNNTQRITTNVLRYKVVKGAIVEGIVPQEPTPQIYEQILNMHSQILAKYESIFTDINKVVADAVLQGVVNQNDPTQLCKFWYGTRAEFDALTTKENNTIYYVVEDNQTAQYKIHDDSGTNKRVILEDTSGTPIYPRVLTSDVYKNGSPYKFFELKTVKVWFTNKSATLKAPGDKNFPYGHILFLVKQTQKHDSTEYYLNYIHNFKVKYTEYTTNSSEEIKITILDDSEIYGDGFYQIVYFDYSIDWSV